MKSSRAGSSPPRSDFSAAAVDGARGQIARPLGQGTARLRDSRRQQQALADYEAALALTGDPAAGRKVFEKACASCHRVADVGIAFAPDISDSRRETPLQILTDTIQPNRAVDSNYFAYTAVTVDGLTHAGILAAETPTSITLKQAEGKEITLLRDDIDLLESTGLSLMPEGLEKEITPSSRWQTSSRLSRTGMPIDGRTPLK